MVDQDDASNKLKRTVDQDDAMGMRRVSMNKQVCRENQLRWCPDSYGRKAF